MHSSVDIGFCVCTGGGWGAPPDSPVRCKIITYSTASVNLDMLLIPFPPTSEQPEYIVAYRTHIFILDDDTLQYCLYRLRQEDSWNLSTYVVNARPRLSKMETHRRVTV